MKRNTVVICSQCGYMFDVTIYEDTPKLGQCRAEDDHRALVECEPSSCPVCLHELDTVLIIDQ